MLHAVGTIRFGYTSAGLLASEDGPGIDDKVSHTYNFISVVVLSCACAHLCSRVNSLTASLK